METSHDIEVHIVDEHGAVAWTSHPETRLSLTVLKRTQAALAKAEVCKFAVVAESIAVSARVLHAPQSAGGRRYMIRVTRSPSWLAGHTLTIRQREIAELAANGSTIAEIARHLDLSSHTVRTHVRNIYQALGVGNRVELAQSLAFVRAG
ncbi:MAG: helix-turn-helix transcriptional regulator [Deltaproteobacteria bacterium]|nr:helix-turn-helix transcriptional regulator [Deltaproteobacteria bacterium]